MDSIFLCFVFILSLMLIIASLKSVRVEHFVFKKRAPASSWNSCRKPNEWVESKCWKSRVWNKKKKFFGRQKRCHIYCGKPKSKGYSQTKCPVCPSNPQGGGGSNESYLVNPANLHIRDSKYKQAAHFVFKDNFASPTLDFNDSYNKVELLGGGEAMVCRKNYNELCRGDPNKCTLLQRHCVTLDEKNPNIDFRLTDHKVGKSLRNDLSSVKITQNMGNTRLRLSEANDKAVVRRAPNELVVLHADKLAWNDAVSNISFDKGSVTMHNDPWHKGPTSTYGAPGNYEIKNKEQNRKANAIRYTFK